MGGSEAPERGVGIAHDRDDPIKPCGLQQPQQRGPRAHQSDLSARLAGATNPTDEGAQPRRIHERNATEVDDQIAAVGQPGQGCPKIGNRRGVEFTDRASSNHFICCVDVDVHQILVLWVQRLVTHSADRQVNRAAGHHPYTPHPHTSCRPRPEPIAAQALGTEDTGL